MTICLKMHTNVLFQYEHLSYVLSLFQRFGKLFEQEFSYIILGINDKTNFNISKIDINFGQEREVDSIHDNKKKHLLQLE